MFKASFIAYFNTNLDEYFGHGLRYRVEIDVQIIFDLLKRVTSPNPKQEVDLPHYDRHLIKKQNAGNPQSSVCSDINTVTRVSQVEN